MARRDRHAAKGKLVREASAAIWADRPSRSYAIFGVVGLWLTVALVEPAFVTFPLAALGGLWLRREHREEATATEAEDDAWF